MTIVLVAAVAFLAGVGIMLGMAEYMAREDAASMDRASKAAKDYYRRLDAGGAAFDAAYPPWPSTDDSALDIWQPQDTFSQQWRDANGMGGQP